MGKNQGTQVKEEISEDSPLENEEEWANEVKKLAKQHHEKQKSHQFTLGNRFPEDLRNHVIVNDYSAHDSGVGASPRQPNENQHFMESKFIEHLKVTPFRDDVSK